jgi:broad specificity phosphatase PhoE
MIKMAQLIHLSRHGETFQNRLAQKGINWWRDLKYVDDSSIWDLTPRGSTIEPQNLGDYLRFHAVKDNPKDFMITTSGLPRSQYTGNVISDRTRIPKENIHSFKAFEEAIQRELLPELSEDMPWHMLNVHLMSETHEQIAERMRYQMTKVAESYPDKHIIAALHGTVNKNFLKSIGSELKEFGNCGLVTLEYSNGDFRVTEPYRSNKDLEAALKKSRPEAGQDIVKKMQATF